MERKTASKKGVNKMEDIKKKRNKGFKDLFGFGDEDENEALADKKKSKKGKGLDKGRVSAFKKGFFGK
jgi:hypothetical protein